MGDADSLPVNRHLKEGSLEERAGRQKSDSLPRALGDSWERTARELERRESPAIKRSVVSDGSHCSLNRLPPLPHDETMETRGRRPVRAKISVHSDDLERRPGTADSGNLAQTARPDRPIWLQQEEGPRRETREEPPRDVLKDALREGTRDEDSRERKVKRLQQEVQRLTQRLQEADVFSADVPTFSVEDVAHGSQIAQGGFSCVHHGTWRCTPVAVKKIFDPVITEELRAEFETEVRMLSRLRHPNIVTLMAVCRKPLSILTEYVDGGSLFELLHTRDRCPPVLPVMRQAAGALAYMHAVDVVHRDVKSQNVLLTKGMLAKLCDFGLARMRSELCTGSMQWAGTAPYMAPELFAKKRYTAAIDVFAFGVMLWEAVSKEVPHANLDAADIAQRARKDGASLQIVQCWPNSLKSLLKMSLAVDPAGRPSMVQVVEKVDLIVLDFRLDG